MKLTEIELDAAKQALGAHAYNTLFPQPIEWDIVVSHWNEFRNTLSSIDLDTYKPFSSVEVYFPKRRTSFRIAHLLHPYDALFLTSFARTFRDRIEQARPPASDLISFSFRAPAGEVGDRLYVDDAGQDALKSAVETRVTEVAGGFVAATDIVDFFPRLDQHRVINCLQALSQTEHEREICRCLEKLLLGLSRNRSRGIPVGCAASRTLSEALMIDVDDHLMSLGIKFCRNVDDFYLFGETETAVRKALYELAKWLEDQHGLSLNSSKTSIVPASNALERYFPVTTEEQTKRRTMLKLPLRVRIDPYTGEQELDDPTEEDELLGEDLLNTEVGKDFERLVTELAQSERAQLYEMEIVLRSRKGKRNDKIIASILDNLDRLEPIFRAISTYLVSVGDSLTAEERDRIASRLLDYLESADPIDFVWVWLMNVFASSTAWNHRGRLALFSKRFAATPAKERSIYLAQRVNGTRGDVLHLKDRCAHRTSLVLTAGLLATRHLPSPERKHWAQALGLSTLLDKKVAAE